MLVRNPPRNLPPLASCPEDCAVGPTDAEVSDTTFGFWGNGSKNTDSVSSKRRKIGDNESGTYETVAEETNESSFQKAVGTFLSSGCCFLDRLVLPSDFVQTCLIQAKDDYKFLKAKMEKEREKILHSNSEDTHHRLASLSRQDYTEWVARDGGRVDIRYGLNEYPYNCGGLIYNSIVFPLVKTLLNGSCESEEPVQLLYAGVMWGMPIGERNNNTEESCSSCHQKWHADGGHHFSPDQLPEGLTLPPHCINVFYPLVDLTEDNGPTEFRIGSHRRDDAKSSKVEFPLLCPAGSAVLFDYRIQHRGRANVLESSTPNPSTTLSENMNSDIEKARPVLYLAYAKTYFKDHGNTRSGRRLVQDGSSSLWTTRTLEGRPIPYGKGFENYGSSRAYPNELKKKESEHNKGDLEDDVDRTEDDVNEGRAVTSIADNSDGVGERWILFQMTLELPEGKSEILKVHKGDIAVEVAQQFCLKHGLQDDFVSVLAQTIQAQMDAV